MGKLRKLLVGREQVERAGGITAAVGEALSLAALRMMPRAITAYEAVGGAAGDSDGTAMMVQIVVRDEEELREAIGAGAEAVLLVGVSAEEGRRLREIARGLRGDCLVEQENEGEI